MYLDELLNFNKLIKENIAKPKAVGVKKKIGYILFQKSFLRLYEVFARPHLDYDDITSEADLGLLQHPR